jgi:dynein heavy chain
MIKHLMEMDEFTTEKLSNNQLALFHNFLEKPDYNKFFVWLNEASEVETSYDNAPNFFSKSTFAKLSVALNIQPEQYQVAFFLKKSGKTQITLSNIDYNVFNGIVNNNPLDDLLAKMTSEYVPKLNSEPSWPEGVKKEFVANLNKFMATLTEESATMKGKT